MKPAERSRSGDPPEGPAAGWDNRQKMILFCRVGPRLQEPAACDRRREVRATVPRAESCPKRRRRLSGIGRASGRFRRAGGGATGPGRSEDQSEGRAQRRLRFRAVRPRETGYGLPGGIGGGEELARSVFNSQADDGRRFCWETPGSQRNREGEPGASPGSPERPSLPTRSMSDGRLQGGAVPTAAERQRRLRRDSSRKGAGRSEGL